MFISAIRHESATAGHMSPSSWNSLPPPTPSHPSRLSQSIRFELPEPHSKFSLAVYFIYSNVYVSMLLSVCPTLSSPIPPSPGPQVCSLYLSLHCCPENRFINTIFLDFIYIYVLILGTHFSSCFPECDTAFGQQQHCKLAWIQGERAPPTANITQQFTVPFPQRPSTWSF